MKSKVHREHQIRNQSEKTIDFLYTDGSFIPQTGGGGWAVSIYYRDGSSASIGGPMRNQNNIRMELHAVIEALKLIKSSGQKHKITIFVDCELIAEAFQDLLNLWQKKHWRTKNGEIRRNSDLWQVIQELRTPNIVCSKVSAHHGRNKQCDQLARDFAWTCQKTA